MSFFCLPRKIIRISRLNMGRVGHDQVCEISSSRSSVDIAGETSFYKVWHKPTMIVMRMSKNKGIDG